MINALGNYIGSAEKIDPLITSGFITSNTVIGNNSYGYLVIYYDSASAASNNGTGSFMFDTNKEVEYFIVGGGGAGLLGETFCGNFGQILGGGGGGAGGVTNGVGFCFAKKTYTGVAGKGGVSGINGIAPNNGKGAPSYLSGPNFRPSTGDIVIGPGGGAGGPTYLGLGGATTLPGFYTGSAGGSGGGGGGGAVDAGYYEYLGGSTIPSTGNEPLPPQTVPTGSKGTNGYFQGDLQTRVFVGDKAPTGSVTGSPGPYQDIFLGGGGGGAATSGSNFTFGFGTSGSVDWYYITGSADGGNGTGNTITGELVYYAGGGSGFTYQEGLTCGCSTPPAPCNQGQGVAPLWPTGSRSNLYVGGGGLPQQAGTQGLGAGGGTGADGGSGIVIVRYHKTGMLLDGTNI